MATGDKSSSRDLEQGIKTNHSAGIAGFTSSPAFVFTLQKVLAEVIGTYLVIFAGCGSVAVNKIYGNVTFPGVCLTWGLIVMTMIYTLGHISGAHFNPAVTLAFAVFRRFPWKQVPFYILSQVVGSLLASCTLALMFDITPHSFFGTTPSGSDEQSLAIEIITSFILMFVVSGVGTDERAVAGFGGLAIGMVITLDVFVAGPVSGASMNPARSLGPAIVKRTYKGIWVYIIGPIIGTVFGAFAYNLIRSTDKSLRDLSKPSSIISSVTGN